MVIWLCESVLRNWNTNDKDKAPNISLSNDIFSAYDKVTRRVSTSLICSPPKAECLSETFEGPFCLPGIKRHILHDARPLKRQRQTKKIRQIVFVLICFNLKWSNDNHIKQFELIH